MCFLVIFCNKFFFLKDLFFHLRKKNRRVSSMRKKIPFKSTSRREKFCDSTIYLFIYYYYVCIHISIYTNVYVYFVYRFLVVPKLILFFLKFVCLSKFILDQKSHKNLSHVTNYGSVFRVNNLRSCTKTCGRILDTFYRATSKPILNLCLTNFF